jgi:hypothetical protein
MAVLRLHTHLANLPADAPAAKLYEIAKKDTDLDLHETRSIALRLKHLLTKHGHEDDWYTNNLEIPENTNIPSLIHPKTKARRWLHSIYYDLARYELEALEQWATTQQREPLGRVQQYWQITKTDHIAKSQHRSLHKSPFQPLPYITHITDSNTATNLIRIRAQTSQFPAHIPSHHTRDAHDSLPYMRTQYDRRYCPFCLPPRASWGLLEPGNSAPLGTETHFLPSGLLLTRLRTVLPGRLLHQLDIVCKTLGVQCFIAFVPVPSTDRASTSRLCSSEPNS